MSKITLAAIAAVALLGTLGCDRSVPTTSFRPFVPPPARTPCPPATSVTVIRKGATAQELKDALLKDFTVVQLAPDVDMIFQYLPATFYPLRFGRCVSLVSVASLGESPPSGQVISDAVRAGDLAASTELDVPRGDSGVVGDLDFEAEREPRIGSARTPRSLGSRLKFDSTNGGATTFLEAKCLDAGENDGVRISGFRLEGPSIGQQQSYEVAIRIVRCVDVEVSNMEIFGWGGTGITVTDDPGDEQLPGRIHHPDQIRIFGNFFHHNQNPTTGGSARGYGVDISVGAWAAITENLFDWNRHGIAAHGQAGGYLAARNLVLKGGGYHGGVGNRYTHQFDAHGTGSYGIGGDAGVEFWYDANAFQYLLDNAIKIRGKPATRVYFTNNVFPHEGLENDWGNDAINLDTDTNVDIGSGNEIEYDSFGRYRVCDFDGDGVDDLFLATGATWWYSAYGEFPWSYLGAKRERVDRLRFGYFDDDLRCDVLAERGGAWMLASGGYGEWSPFEGWTGPLDNIEFGRFDPADTDTRPGATRRTTHFLERDSNGQWYIVRLRDSLTVTAASSGFDMDQFRFGDFTGDGVTDVLAVVEGRWQISTSGTGAWDTLNTELGDAVRGLYIGNMDADDNIDDILRLEVDSTLERLDSGDFVRVSAMWWRSRNGTDVWRPYARHDFDLKSTDSEVAVRYGFVGRFGAAPGGGTMLIDHGRVGRFYSEAERRVGSEPAWSGLFKY
jgi:hypothetical protein